MIGTAEALQKFLDIVSGATYWKSMLGSQFVRHLSLFQAWALRDAQWKIERAVQELFPSTAMNRSSILAHAESRGYVPAKPVPATGTVSIANDGENSVTIPLNQRFLSDSQIDYLCTETAVIASGSSVEVSFSQLRKEVLEFEVTIEKAFHELLLDKETSAKVSALSVEIDSGSGFEPWDYAPQFRNTLPVSKVYDQFYSIADELGIRFGSGSFGAVPPAGSSVKVTLWLTEGDIELPIGQSLYLVGQLLDSASQPALLTAVVSETIYGGCDPESTESTRKSLAYWPLYNEELVWREDYEFALKRRFPEIRWINIWGEGEQEAESGFDVQNINKIFVCLYAAGGADIQADVMSFLDGLKLFNRKFTWVAPVSSAFHLIITGTVPRGFQSSHVRQAVLNALEAAYDPDSKDRLSELRLSDVYRIVSGTGYFAGSATFSVEVAGVTEPTQLAEMVHIDMSATTVTIGYP